MLLNTDRAPSDPIERLLWLSGVQARVSAELDDLFGAAYFEARIAGRLDAAVEAGPHSRRQVLAYTRHENERRGRQVRWGDGADPSSTAYATS